MTITKISIQNLNKMKNVLVTGANGQLGNEMRRLGSVSPNNYIFTDVAELDITDKAAVVQFVATNSVDVIVNCAAYTNVDKAEDDQATAELINATAVANLAEAVKAVDGTLIHVSTDYVISVWSVTTKKARSLPTLRTMKTWY